MFVGGHFPVNSTKVSNLLSDTLCEPYSAIRGGLKLPQEMALDELLQEGVPVRALQIPRALIVQSQGEVVADRT